MAVFYPAMIDESSAKPFVMPFFTKLTLYRDAEIAFDGEKLPLVMLSHGRGSTGLSYAWFAQTLASHGYIVAAPYHLRANSYDSTVAYLANKLCQRPVDVILDIDFLLSDPVWSKYIDPGRIGAAGHSHSCPQQWGRLMMSAKKYAPAFERQGEVEELFPTPTEREFQERHLEALEICADWKESIERRRKRLLLRAELIGGVDEEVGRGQIFCVMEP
jgi:predicted peptidase